MKKYPITRICKALGISRSNQYQNSKSRPNRYRCQSDEGVLEEIKTVAKVRATYGYRRVTGILHRERASQGLLPYNHKRVYRLIVMNGLVLPRNDQKPKRPHDGKIITLQSNRRYCSDIMEIHCWSGEEVHIAFSLDCHDREVMAYVAKPKDLDHRDIMKLMDETVIHRFGPSAETLPHPIEWLSDNGPQYTAKETENYGKQWGFLMCTTPPYSPQSNGLAEAFVKTFKRDYVYTHELLDAETVIRQLPLWFEDYNRYAPHSGLKYRSPWDHQKLDNPVSV